MFIPTANVSERLREVRVHDHSTGSTDVRITICDSGPGLSQHLIANWEVSPRGKDSCRLVLMTCRRHPQPIDAQKHKSAAATWASARPSYDDNKTSSRPFISNTHPIHLTAVKSRDGIPNGCQTVGGECVQAVGPAPDDTKDSLLGSTVDCQKPRDIRFGVYRRWAGWIVACISITIESIHQESQDCLDRWPGHHDYTRLERSQCLLESMFLVNAVISTLFEGKWSLESCKGFQNTAISWNERMGWG